MTLMADGLNDQLSKVPILANPEVAWEIALGVFHVGLLLTGRQVIKTLR